MPPKQIEFAKLYLTNVVTGKRYIKKLVEDGVVDGWDDPRLVINQLHSEDVDLHQSLSACLLIFVVWQRQILLLIMQCLNIVSVRT